MHEILWPQKKMTGFTIGDMEISHQLNKINK